MKQLEFIAYDFTWRSSITYSKLCETRSLADRMNLIDLGFQVSNRPCILNQNQTATYGHRKKSNLLLDTLVLVQFNERHHVY